LILTPMVIADTPTCSIPNHEATVVAAVTPAPDAARSLKAPATAVIQVTIGPDGKLISAKVAQSSKNPAIDQAALDAASKTTYAPKVVNCQPVTESYAFPYTFDPMNAPVSKPSSSPLP
jgi:TonB family protein